jgi:uncharacterized sulfatase
MQFMSKHLAIVVLLAIFSAAGLAERPNILWITCEDMSPRLGCYGDPLARTPHLDALAKQGVRYTRAYATAGVCAPARSSLITGVWPSSYGSHGMRSDAKLPANIRCFSELLRDAGYYCTNNAKTDYNFAVPKAAWDESSGKAHWRKRPEGKPFFAVFNFITTHESRVRQAESVFAKQRSELGIEATDPASVTVPPYHPDTPEVRRDWAHLYDNIAYMDHQVSQVLAELAADGLADSTIVFFYSDHGDGMPGVKKWIWHDGLHVPLIVRFPDKFAHLAPAKAGETTDRLVSFLDFGPTVLSLAGVKVPPVMHGVPFLGEQAGEPRRYVHANRDRMAERYDPVRGVSDGRYLYLRNYTPHRTPSQFTSYTEEMPTMKVWRRLAEAGKLSGHAARYFAPTKPVEELYDLQADPRNVNNLAHAAEHRQVLELLRAENRRRMLATHDLGLLHEYEMERRAAESTKWDVAHDPKLNPLEALMAAADLANAMDSANLPALVELSKHADPAMRWWGVTGLVALGESAAPALAAIERALADESPVVRIAAAEAIAQLGDEAKALPVLTAALQHDHPVVRLEAINVLDRMGEAARPAADAIRAAKLGGKDHVSQYVDRMVEYVPEKFE